MTVSHKISMTVTIADGDCVLAGNEEKNGFFVAGWLA